MSRKHKKVNETVNNEVIITESEEEVVMEEKKNVFVKMGETVGKVASSKPVKIGTKVVLGIGLAVGGFAAGYKSAKSKTEYTELESGDYEEIPDEVTTTEAEEN